MAAAPAAPAAPANPAAPATPAPGADEVAALEADSRVVVRLDGVPVESIGDLLRLLTGERVGHRLVAGPVRGGDLPDVPLVPREL